VRPIERAGYMAHARTKWFRKRLCEAKRVVGEMLHYCNHPYIAFSGGKDSTCVLSLVWEQAPEVPAVYFDAACAFPETYELLDRLEKVGRPIIRWPCQPFLDILEQAGGPNGPHVEEATMMGTVYRPIKTLLAAKHYDGVLLGLRRDESNGRRVLIHARGLLFPNKRDGIMECLPVGWWSYQEVWAYIISRELDYNRAYDKQSDLPIRNRRISYWAGESERHNGRWVWLRRTYPDLWNQFAARFPEVGSFT